MKERLQAVRTLRRQYGDESVPGDELAALGFVCREDEGVQIYISYEQVVKQGIQSERTESSDGQTLPKTTFEVTCPTDLTIGARTNRRELAKRLHNAQSMLNASGTSWNRYSDAESMMKIAGVGGEGSFSQVYARYRELENTQISNGGPGLVTSFNTVFETAHSSVDDHTTWSFSLADLESKGRWDQAPSQQEAEVIMAELQQRRSIVGDTAELERIYESELRLGMFQLEDGSGRAKTVDTGTISLQAEIWASVLDEAGFASAATQLREVHTLAEAKAVMAASLRSNEAKSVAKQVEKDWQARRKQATTPDEIHVLSAERARIKQDLHDALQPLYGIETFVNLVREYQKVSIAAIKDVENALLAKSESQTLRMTFDTRPDAELDANPGRVSGDCTDGESLTFGGHTGLRNVRVMIDGKHTGNVYLYQAKTTVGENVWHLDAIQIPHRTVRWNAFPQQLIDQLSPLAEAANVEAITINNQQHYVSNYDYISRGFMEYFGTASSWQEHDHMQLIDNHEVGSVAPDESTTCEVDFSRYEQNMDRAGKRLQGMDDRQVYLWRKQQGL